MWHKIKHFSQNWINEIKGFFGSDANEGFKTTFWGSLIAIPLNALFFFGLYKIFHLQTPESRQVVDILILMLASPLIILEVTILAIGIYEKKIFSVFFFMNVFLMSAWFYFGFLKIFKLVEPKLNSIFESEEEHENWTAGYYQTPYTSYTFTIPQRNKDIAIKTLDLWPMISNTKDFVYNNFQNSQALLRFFKERLCRPGENQLDNDFLYFSLLLPKKKEISVEGLKSILMSYPGMSPNPFYEKLPRAFLESPILEQAFKTYTEVELKKLFCRRYDPRDYFELLSLIAKTPSELPLMDNFKELIIFLNQNILARLHHPVLEKIHNTQLEEFKFVLITKKEEYSLWAKKLDNCLERSYVDQEGVDVIGIMRGRQFYGALSFRQGSFEQLKGYKNSEISHMESEKILAYLKNKIKS